MASSVRARAIQFSRATIPSTGWLDRTRRASSHYGRRSVFGTLTRNQGWGDGVFNWSWALQVIYRFRFPSISGLVIRDLQNGGSARVDLTALACINWRRLISNDWLEPSGARKRVNRPQNSPGCLYGGKEIRWRILCYDSIKDVYWCSSWSLNAVVSVIYFPVCPLAPT